MTASTGKWPNPLPPSREAQVQGDVGVLRLSRPPKRNAFSDEVVLRLTAFFSPLPEQIKGIVVGGAGDHFCAGLD